MTSDTAVRSILMSLALGLIAHGMNQTIMLSVLAPIGLELGFQEIQIGSVLSGSALAFFFFSRLWGRLSDRVGRKPILIVGLVGSSLGSLAMAKVLGLGLSGAWLGTGLYLAIVLTRMVQSMLSSGTHPSATAYVADITSPSTRTAGMGKIGAAYSMGSILGPAVAGLLAGVSLLLPIYVGAMIAGAMVALVWRLLPPSPALLSHRPGKKLSYFDPRLNRYLIVGILIFLAFCVVQQTLAFRLQDSLGLDARATARQYGLMMMISAATAMFAQMLLVSCIKLTVDMRAFDAHAPLLSKSPQHFLSIRTVFYLRYVFR